jgi:zinc transporter ZupT
MRHGTSGDRDPSPEVSVNARNLRRLRFTALAWCVLVGLGQAIGGVIGLVTRENDEG